MGTPEFAVPPLEALIGSQHEVIGVVTVADKPAGRGRKLRESAVKQCATANGIKILQPIKLKDPEFLEALRNLEADLFVVVAFRMLPRDVWNMPALGTFNLHGSLLPAYRGAAPIHWAVINGESETGLTTFMLDEEIDTGKILLTTTYSIPYGSTTGEVHDALMPMGAQLVLDTVDGIATNNLFPKDQDHSKASHAPKLNAHNSELDFQRTPEELVHQILGLNPFPGAHFSGYKFLNAEVSSDQIKTDVPHLQAINKELLLTYALGSVRITEIKPQGKRLMKGKDFLNGMKGSKLPL
jgi:methionyl-tRNA formyltransferase